VLHLSQANWRTFDVALLNKIEQGIMRLELKGFGGGEEGSGAI
jgi:hypothetical protein